MHTTNVGAIFLPRVFPSADIPDIISGSRVRFVPTGLTFLTQAELEERGYMAHAAAVKLVTDRLFPDLIHFTQHQPVLGANLSLRSSLSHSPVPEN